MKHEIVAWNLQPERIREYADSVFGLTGSIEKFYDTKYWHHVFGKHEVGFCSHPNSGGLILESVGIARWTWIWFSPGITDGVSTGNYGLMEEEEA